MPQNALYKIKKTLKNTWEEISLPSPTPREKMLIKTLRDKLSALPSLPFSVSYSAAENEWNKNIASLRKTMLRKDPRRFLTWDVVTATMFFKGKDLELTYLQKRPDWLLWKEAIRESPIGSPLRYPTHRDSSGNLIHHAYSLARFLSDCDVNINNLSSVFEFGGGYGSMCRLFYQLGYTKQYIMFDLPEFTLLQEFFLQSLDKTFNISQKPSQTEHKQILLFSNLEALRTQANIQKIDLMIGTWSLSEASIPLRGSILKAVDDPQYYLFAFQKKFNEVDNEKYFSSFAKTHSGYEWKLSSVEHLPDNFYLFGRKLHTL